MIRIFTLSLVTLLFSFSLMAKERTQGEILVRLDGSQSDAIQAFTEAFAHFGVQHVRVVAEQMNIHLFAFNEEVHTRFDNCIVEEINTAHRERSDNRTVAQYNFFIQHRSVPNDPYFSSNQWGLRNTGQFIQGFVGEPGADIDAPSAWAIADHPQRNNRQIVVAVIDDGFRLTHDDLVFTQTGKSFTVSPATVGNADIPNREHGTHVAGIAGAISNNNAGVASIGWNIAIKPIAIPLGMGDAALMATAISAYDHILAQRLLYNQTNGAQGYFVVATNSSFGIDRGNPANFLLWEYAFDRLGQAGILSAVAAANLEGNIDNIGDVPGNLNSAWQITVTNTNNRDLRQFGASWGPHSIDLGAPGTNIFAPGNQSDSHYRFLSGTSMSSPMVAGTIALMYRTAPEEMLEEFASNPGELALLFRQFIMDGVDPLPALAPYVRTGGRLNAKNAVLFVYNHNQEPVYGISSTVSDTHTFPERVFGQSPPTAHTVTLTNTGNRSTGELTLVLDGENYEYFTLSRTSIPNIVASGTADFSVAPNSGLGGGVHTATVKITGENELYESFEVSFTVNRATGLALDQAPTAVDTTYHSITIRASEILANGQATEYAISFASTTPVASLVWQTDTIFTELLANTTYFVHARTAQNQNFNAGPRIASGGIRTFEHPATNIDIVETQCIASLQVFPNPVTDQLYIVIPSEARDLFANNPVEIFDMNGWRVFSKPICQSSIVNRKFTINISHLPPGTYILKIGEHAVRLVKQ